MWESVIFSMFCCMLLYVHSSIAIILMGKRELIALLNLSSWCLVMVERLFLAVPRGCLQFVIVVFPDHTHLLFFISITCTSHFLNITYLPTSDCSWFIYWAFNLMFYPLFLQVLQSVIETEKAHVNEMTSVLQNYIRPINSSDM